MTPMAHYTFASPPLGPAASLFQQSYFELLRKALKPGGIVCSQGENMWFHKDLITSLLTSCAALYPTVDYAYTCIPTYPGGQIGFILCSLNPVSYNAISNVISSEAHYAKQKILFSKGDQFPPAGSQADRRGL